MSILIVHKVLFKLKNIISQSSENFYGLTIKTNETLKQKS